MSARLHASLALGLALGLHVAGFALQPGPAGAVSAGAGGADMLSLQAADASLSDLIAEWDRPPAPDPTPVAEVTPPTPPKAALLPVPEAVAALPTLPAPEALMLPTQSDSPPAADVSLPPPAPPSPEPEPVAKPDPDLRPKPRPPELAKPKAPAKPLSVQRVTEQPAPKPTPKPASAGQAPQRAAGSGDGAQAGDSGTAPSATLSKARRNDLTARWGAAIRTRVERRKSYPAAARGASGTVTVRLTVSRAGQLASVSVVSSSGHPPLDQAALRAVQSARFPAAPDGLTDASYSFTLPMKFTR